jgi:hypothetical protein
MSVRHLTLAFAVLALLPATASAAEIYPSVSPTVLRGPPPWHVDYAIEFDSGPAPEQVTFSVSGRNGFPPTPRLDGPGTLTSAGVILLGGGRTCASGFGDIDFGVSGGGSWTLDLPPGASTVVRIGVDVSRQFRLDEQRFDDVQISVDGFDGQIAGPELAVSRAVPLSASLRLAAGAKFVQPGDRVTIAGRTSAELAGGAIDLRATYGGARYVGKPDFNAPVARVRVAADGTFRYQQWRPTMPGRWAVSAFYDSHDPRFLDSAMEGCFPSVQVGQPPRT